ncbi:MAG: redoxin domain-containing protein [Solirubrobacterales bacterium]
MSLDAREGEAKQRRSLLVVIATCLGSLALVALLTYGLIQKAPDTSIAESLARGEPTPAPSFDLEVLDQGSPPAQLRPRLERATGNGQIALEELRGVPTVVNFWASWCTPCRQEARLLQETWERVGKDGVLFLGINMQDARSDARAFIDEFEIDYPSVREPARETGVAYGATGIPETYFLTADGRVAGRHVGPIEPDELRAGIRAARSGRVLGAQENAPKPELRLVPVKPKREQPDGQDDESPKR